MLERTAETPPDDPRTGGARVLAEADGPALTGRGLDAGTVARIAGGAPPAAARPAWLAGMERAHRAAQALAAEGTRAYGRTTGVGAHRGGGGAGRDRDGPDPRLRRPHPGGLGGRGPGPPGRAGAVAP
ncbi:hypothetical protein ACFV2J_29470, partial [Streptomyces sp. NPDC059668]